MTRQIKTYVNKNVMLKDKKIMAVQSFRSIHTDFIKIAGKLGYRVTYDNTPDVPIPKRRLTESAFIRELALNSDIELI